MMMMRCLECGSFWWDCDDIDDNSDDSVAGDSNCENLLGCVPPGQRVEELKVAGEKE